MVNWAAVAAGADEGMREDERKRSELADAFGQFRERNPYATMQEFQAFIDAKGGGRNYLRGGAPSKDILTSIAADNKKAKGRDDFNKRLADVQARQQTMEQVGKLVDTELLNMEGDDFVGARDRVTSQFGPDMAPFLESMGINQMFSPSRLQAVQSKAMQEYMPGLMTLIESSEGQITAADIKKMYPQAPTGIIGNLVQEANRVHDEKLATTQRDRKVKVAETTASIRASLASDPIFQSLIRTNDIAGAQAMIDTATAGYVDAYGDDFLPKDFGNTIITSVQSNMQLAQQGEWKTAYDANNERQKGIGTAVIDKSVTRAGEAFPLRDKDDLGQRLVALAIQDAAREFDMNSPAALTALQGLADVIDMDNPDEAKHGNILAAVKGLLTDAGVPTVAQTQAALSKAQGGFVPERQSFNDFLNSEKQTVQTDTQEVADLVAKAERSASIPERQRLMQQAGALLAVTVDEAETRQSGAAATVNIWLPVGMDRFDPLQIERMQDQYKSQWGDLQKRLQAIADETDASEASGAILQERSAAGRQATRDVELGMDGPPSAPGVTSGGATTVVKPQRVGRGAPAARDLTPILPYGYNQGQERSRSSQSVQGAPSTGRYGSQMSGREPAREEATVPDMRNSPQASLFDTMHPEIAALKWEQPDAWNQAFAQWLQQPRSGRRQ